MRQILRLSVLTAALAGAACSDSSSTEPRIEPTTDSIVVNASQASAYVRLGTPATVVTVADPTTSNEWDVSLFATTVTLNGGAAGPGSITGFCVCANANATDDAIRLLTPATALPAFEGLTASAIPADDSFHPDQLAPAISGWVTGSGASARVVTDRSWILREGTTAATLGKIHITDVQQATAATAGRITFEYAVQATAGAAFGAVQTRTVDVSGGTVYFDLTSGAVSSSANWDLRFEGYQIRLNSGVSGSGSMGAIVEMTRPFAAIDAPYAATAPAQAYRRDGFSGVFAQQPWYRYNITGTDNQIWPTYNVYLVKRGDAVYKVQLIGYYGPAGESRIITMRYARLR